MNDNYILYIKNNISSFWPCNLITKGQPHKSSKPKSFSVYIFLQVYLWFIDYTNSFDCGSQQTVENS